MAQQAKILCLDLHSPAFNQLHYLVNFVPIDTQIKVAKFHHSSPCPRSPADSAVWYNTSLRLFTGCGSTLWAGNINLVLSRISRYNELVSDQTLLIAGQARNRCLVLSSDGQSAQ